MNGSKNITFKAQKVLKIHEGRKRTCLIEEGRKGMTIERCHPVKKRKIKKAGYLRTLVKIIFIPSQPGVHFYNAPIESLSNMAYTPK